MQNNNLVGVYIITHNRLNTLIRSLESVINQDFKDFSIVISDNSDNDDTMVAMQKYVESDTRIQYIRQTDAPSGIDHINKVLRDNTFEYFMMFHDDDEMLPNMVGTLYNAIKDEPKASAVVSDVFINDNGKYLNKRMVNIKERQLISAEKLVVLYSIYQSPAFPAYMYRSKNIKGLCLNKREGGKYSDASFLVKVASNGLIMYIPDCLMYYFRYSSQDSACYEFSQYLSLLAFFKKQMINKEILRQMRLRNIFLQIIAMQGEGGLIPFKRKALFLFFRYSLFKYFPRYLYRIFLRVRNR